MWERARKRAKRDGLPFEITHEMIIFPERCPVLGIPLRLGEDRSPASPSLDRIVPSQGYVPGNIRVISDRANILKGNSTQEQLQIRASVSRRELREEYSKIVKYMMREALLAEVRKRADAQGRHAYEWRKVAVFLERAFQRGDGLG